MKTRYINLTTLSASLLLPLALILFLLIPTLVTSTGSVQALTEEGMASSKEGTAFSAQAVGQALTPSAVLSGTYQGTVAITVPIQLGVLDFAFELRDEGALLAGSVNRSQTLVYDDEPALSGVVETSVTTPTFQLTSEVFDDVVSGRHVERQFTLVGELLEGGEVLQGVYSEVMTGFTPQPLNMEGLFMVTRPPDTVRASNLLVLTTNTVRTGTTGQVVATARVLDAEGQAVSGMVVTFASQLGTMSPASGTTNANGMAISTFTAGDMPGQAQIEATCCDGTSKSVLLQVETQLPAAIELAADESSLSIASQTNVTATVRDQFDHPMSGTLVTFQGTLGSISPASAVTDEDGEASATFTAADEAGEATITALAESTSDSLTIEITDSGAPSSDVSIPLLTGWNLISIPVQPDSSAIADVLASIEGNYTLVRAYNGCDSQDPWKTYDPSAPPFANDLTDLNVSLALWINMSAADTLELTGQVQSNPTISLCTGWNLVAYPSLQAENVSDALSSINGAYTLVRSYNASDSNDPWKTYDPSAPPFANDLIDMQPGVGYWIRATQEVDWTIE